MATFGNSWHILEEEEEQASQEEEEASQEEEEEVRVNNHEWSADVLELELDL